MIDAAKLIRYNIWANRRLTEQTKCLSNELFTKELGGSFPSIQLTLRHLVESDWIWMHRWKGISFVDVPSTWSIHDAPSLLSTWYPIQNQIEEIVSHRTAQPNDEVVFTTRKGDSFSLPFVDTVMHSTNHGTYHRGQVVNMLRMLGEKPVNTDYFVFCTVSST